MSEITEAPPIGVRPAPEAGGGVLGGRYRVADLIGRGGMADVHRAYDEVLDRPVAVKVFRTPAADSPAGSERERQHAEVRALATLNHPNLTALYDASVDSDPPFLVLELIEGRSLAAELAKGPLSEPAVRSIGRQLADALAYVHSRHMVHRDVKPANILLGNDATSLDALWRVRLSDFGIVRLLGTARLTQVSFTLGSASYLAPEQARGGDVGPAADIYSLGLVLTEALTGRPCFDGTAPEALAARLVRPPEVPADLPQPWPGLLTAMTALEPSARPTAADVARVLRDQPTLLVDPSGPTTHFVAAGLGELGPVLAGPPLDTGMNPGAGDEDGYERRHRRSLITAGLLAVIAAGIVAILHSSLPGVAATNRLPASQVSSGSSPLAVVVSGKPLHTTSASVVRQPVAANPVVAPASKPAAHAATTAGPAPVTRQVVPPVSHPQTTVAANPPTPSPSSPPSTSASAAPSSPNPSLSTSPTGP